MTRTTDDLAPPAVVEGAPVSQRPAAYANLPVDTLCSWQVNLDDATPMMRQFIEVKQQYTGVLLLYRMGDFYETFFEDAVIAARALEITLTGRDSGKLGRVPMAGIPVRALDSYMQRLLDQQFKVAICEQVQDPALAKGLVERRVTRVLSSGTLSDQQFLKSDEANYLAAIAVDGKSQRWALAYCDVSTGRFACSSVGYESLLAELDRLQPAELLVLGKRVRGDVVDEWRAAGPAEIVTQHPCTPLKPEAFDSKRATGRIEQWFGVASLDGFGLDGYPEAIAACGAVLGYIDATLLDEARPVFDGIRFTTQTTALLMNQPTRRHLELLRTARDGRREGSLLWVLDKTQTAMGARLLREWVVAPSVSLNEIESRLATVERLVSAPDVRLPLAQRLADVYDMERLALKVQNATIMPRDLHALLGSCRALMTLAGPLAGESVFYLQQLQALPEAVHEFCSRVETAIADNPGVTLADGNIMREGYNAQLDQLRDVVNNQAEWLDRYELSERETTGLKTLKLGYTHAFGYYIEISKAMAKQAPERYTRKQTLTNAERFITPELKAHEDQVITSKAQLADVELTLYTQLRRELMAYGAVLKDVARKVAIADILCGFGQAAVDNGYCRPVVDDSLELVLHECRHPVIEQLLPLGAFVRNDCVLSATVQEEGHPQLMIITGPNMAGKSTYMRQVALAVVMAQMGCFVPAAYARVGMVDQLFTRIGAVDDLSSGQSTFMVEMTETATILHRATNRSLVLLDEVGRGTSTYDGVSIAWSVADHLVRHNGARTLFATHYHELNTLEATHPKIRNMRVLVKHEDGQIQFLHTVVAGSAQQSYGIDVARMAGLPMTVIDKAQKLLATMHQKEFSAIDSQRKAALLKTAQSEQLSIFGATETST
ncbi:MAG: DNA mismatch repair protein MutS [Cyanobacteria bacterium HKST-UBA04]|nr:DNA mismatch repair protein MutS [Cyanobacteria bacterium HKST-UBA04]